MTAQDGLGHLLRIPTTSAVEGDGQPRLLIMLPAYNEAGRIAPVIEGIRRHANADILVIDDGSSDGTASEARRSGARVASHPANLGYGCALQTGYRYALRHGYDAVIQMDSDGQHDPASIPALIEALSSADIVVGSRFLHRASYTPPLARRLGSWLFGKLAGWLASAKVSDPTSGFQAISREGLRFYVHERYPSDFPDADVLAMGARAGLRLVEVPVRMLPAPAGRSMHRGILRPVYYVLRMTLALALVPLRKEER